MDDPRVLALWQVLCLFLGLPEGWRNATMRAYIAQALCMPPETSSPGRMAYDCAACACTGSSNGSPTSHCYQVTQMGIRVALFFTKVQSRILRPGLSQLFDGCPEAPHRPVATALRRLDQAFAGLFDQARLAPGKI